MQTKFIIICKKIINTFFIKKYISSLEKILGTSKPNKIILSKKDTIFKKLLKCRNLIVLKENGKDYTDKFIIEICKWILDKTSNKFHIIPVYQKSASYRIKSC